MSIELLSMQIKPNFEHLKFQQFASEHIPVSSDMKIGGFPLDFPKVLKFDIWVNELNFAPKNEHIRILDVNVVTFRDNCSIDTLMPIKHPVFRVPRFKRSFEQYPDLYLCTRQWKYKITTNRRNRFGKTRIKVNIMHAKLKMQM